MFLNIQIDLLILKTYDGQFTLTTKKSLHIIFKCFASSYFIVFPRLDSSLVSRSKCAVWLPTARPTAHNKLTRYHSRSTIRGSLSVLITYWLIANDARRQTTSVGGPVYSDRIAHELRRSVCLFVSQSVAFLISGAMGAMATPEFGLCPPVFIHSIYNVPYTTGLVAPQVV